MDIRLFRCEHCGNIAIKVVDSAVPLVCCGQKMTELVPASIDAALEKHVPVVQVEGNKVHVEVGEVLHPMTEEHLIQMIILQTARGFQFIKLTEVDKPVADFVIAEGDKAEKVFEYCNLHGLWVKEI